MSPIERWDPETGRLIERREHPLTPWATAFGACAIIGGFWGAALLSPAARGSATIGGGGGQDYALQFEGGGGADQPNRMRVLIHDTATTDPSAAIDSAFIGDFTVEMWIYIDSIETGNTACTQTSYTSWTNHDIIFDKDRANQAQGLGMAIDGSGNLNAGAVASGNEGTACGSTVIAEDTWTHIAMTRNASTGDIATFIDGNRDTLADLSVTASIRYPNDGVPQATGCEGRVCYGDPYIVLGAEKNDFTGVFGFNGRVDELRISDTIRYSGTTYTVPTDTFAVDQWTAGLFHFDEGSGTDVSNVSTWTGNTAFTGDGVLQAGGTSSALPTWVTGAGIGGS